MECSLPSSPSVKETRFITPANSRSNSLFGIHTDDQLVTHNDDQAAFGEKRERLVSALDSTEGLVKGLQSFNQNKWTIHYPTQLGISGSTTSSSGTTSLPSTPRKLRSSSARRARTSHGGEAEPTEEDDLASEPSSPSRPPPPQRAFSTETASTVQQEVAPAPAHPLSILSLDLKLGHPTAPTASLPALLPSLSLATLSQLLSRRLTTSLTHLSSLRTRVVDTSSRILVTGDLNAGKSTLVNALLRRDVMPSDQQPCTTVFCEVLDAASYNSSIEEIHAIRDMEKYDPTDFSTFDRFPLEEVNEVQDSPPDTYQILKAYVTDARAPLLDTSPNPSFIKNDLVSLSLIDAPGLNRDTLSTTALFARQSEIDVIVFVVSAENHFTLSAKEFLWNASREKAYVFIVVNKWAGIKDKKRCMRVVGEQIKQLSPATWDARAELVHFVDAAEAVDAEETVGEKAEDEETSSFDHLEQSLRSFVLLKRSRSKLAPAKHYLLNLLADLSTLASGNVIVASAELKEALAQLALVKPIHERLSAQRDNVEENVDKVEESVVDKVKTAAWTRLERAMGYVSEGLVVPPTEADATRRSFANTDSITAPTSLPPYPGVFGIWTWASDVKRTLVRSLEAEVRSAEDDARVVTVEGVSKVMNDLAEKYLPGEEQDVNARVFRPEVMFAKRRRGMGKLAARGISSGLGLGSAGVGLAASGQWSASEFEVSFLDFFDLERIYSPGGSAKGKAKKVGEDDDAIETGALVSLGVGGMGMIGSRLIGVKGTLDSVQRVMEILGSKQAREWAAPVIGVLTVGFAAYLVYDLPRALPLNIGRKLEASLSSPTTDSLTAPPSSFSAAHSDRIARESRKVLRLAGWDLRERFRTALEKSANERKEVEETMKKAEGAIEWLGEFVEKVEREERRVEEVEV